MPSETLSIPSLYGTVTKCNDCHYIKAFMKGFFMRAKNKSRVVYKLGEKHGNFA